jgi:hypothetical protein
MSVSRWRDTRHHVVDMRSTELGLVTRWEAAHLSARFDGLTQQWTLTVRVPGREIEKRSAASGVDWISDILNELGQEGWELVDRVATSTGGDAFVTGWQFIFKRPAG